MTKTEIVLLDFLLILLAKLWKNILINLPILVLHYTSVFKTILHDYSSTGVCSFLRGYELRYETAGDGNDDVTYGFSREWRSRDKKGGKEGAMLARLTARRAVVT